MTRAALAGLLLAACAGAVPSAAPEALAGTRWILVFDRAPSMPAPTLEIGDTRAAGFAGCNTWFASVSQQGDSLRFGAIGMTRMACPPMAMSIEREFIDALTATRYVRREGEALVLLDENRDAVSAFAPLR